MLPYLVPSLLRWNKPSNNGPQSHQGLTHRVARVLLHLTFGRRRGSTFETQKNKHNPKYSFVQRSTISTKWATAMKCVVVQDAREAPTLASAMLPESLLPCSLSLSLEFSIVLYLAACVSVYPSTLVSHVHQSQPQGCYLYHTLLESCLCRNVHSRVVTESFFFVS